MTRFKVSFMLQNFSQCIYTHTQKNIIQFVFELYAIYDYADNFKDQKRFCLFSNQKKNYRHDHTPRKFDRKLKIYYYECNQFITQ